MADNSFSDINSNMNIDDMFGSLMARKHIGMKEIEDVKDEMNYGKVYLRKMVFQQDFLIFQIDYKKKELQKLMKEN